MCTHQGDAWEETGLARCPAPVVARHVAALRDPARRILLRGLFEFVDRGSGESLRIVRPSEGSAAVV
jgi:hypothetical protein